MGKKTHLECSQHLVLFFFFSPTDCCLLNVSYFRSRKIEEEGKKEKKLQGGGGRLHTETRLRLSSLAARFTTKCCVSGDAHDGVRHPKTLGKNDCPGIAYSPAGVRWSPAAPQRRSSTKRCANSCQARHEEGIFAMRVVRPWPRFPERW